MPQCAAAAAVRALIPNYKRARTEASENHLRATRQQINGQPTGIISCSSQITQSLYKYMTREEIHLCLLGMNCKSILTALDVYTQKFWMEFDKQVNVNNHFHLLFIRDIILINIYK
jgi:choline kinase